MEEKKYVKQLEYSIEICRSRKAIFQSRMRKIFIEFSNILVVLYMNDYSRLFNVIKYELVNCNLNSQNIPKINVVFITIV